MAKWKQLIFSFSPPKVRMEITATGGKEQYLFSNSFVCQPA